MKNLKVGKKLLVAFGVVVFLMLVSIVLSILSLNSITQGMESFYNGPFIVTATSNAIENKLNEAGKNMLHSCVAKGADETSQRLEMADACIKEADTMVNTIKSIYRGAKSDIDGLEAALVKVQESYPKVKQLSLANDVEGAFAEYKSSFATGLQECSNYVAKIKETSSATATSVHKSSQTTSKGSVVMMLVIGLISVVATVTMCTYITKGITTPIKELEFAADQMSKGIFDAPLTYHSRDELGVLSKGIRHTSETLNNVVSDMSRLLDNMKDGDFDVHTTCEESYVGLFQKILLSMRQMNNSLSDALRQIDQAADQVASGSNQVSSGAQALSQGATEQASSIEELAATVNEISSHVEQNAENALQASAKSRETSLELENGKSQMEQMMAAMENINDTSSQISKIVKTIEDIAFQTNILALNAAVEAARAGEAGKGFAVVADEVRNLASKSSEASKNTSALIENSVKSVEEGTQIANATSQSMEKIIKSSEEAAELVHKISTASQEQATSIAQVTQGIDQISSVVQTNSATAEESAAASEELSGQSIVLKDLTSRFKLKSTANISVGTNPGANAGVSVSTGSGRSPQAGAAKKPKTESYPSAGADYSYGPSDKY